MKFILPRPIFSISWQHHLRCWEISRYSTHWPRRRKQVLSFYFFNVKLCGVETLSFLGVCLAEGLKCARIQSCVPARRSLKAASAEISPRDLLLGTGSFARRPLCWLVQGRSVDFEKRWLVCSQRFDCLCSSHHYSAASRKASSEKKCMLFTTVWLDNVLYLLEWFQVHCVVISFRKKHWLWKELVCLFSALVTMCALFGWSEYVTRLTLKPCFKQM